MDYYQLVSTSRKRELVSPFCFRGERVAAFCLEEAAIRMAKCLRDNPKCPTVYGCYRQPDGTWLIGPASARPVGKYWQTLSLRKVSGKLPASVEVWKSVTVGRVVFSLDAFVRSCLAFSYG